MILGHQGRSNIITKAPGEGGKKVIVGGGIGEAETETFRAHGKTNTEALKGKRVDSPLQQPCQHDPNLVRHVVDSDPEDSQGGKFVLIWTPASKLWVTTLYGVI